MNYKIVNFALFQLGWFTCVLGGANTLPMIGVGYALLFLLIHATWQGNAVREFSFITLVALFGFGIDSLLVTLGYFSYTSAIGHSFAPFWIAALWAMFAATIGHSMAWLSSRPILSSLLGAVFGPVAYFSASKFGADTLLEGGQGLYLQAIVWSTMMPSMYFLYQVINDFSNRPKAEKAL